MRKIISSIILVFICLSFTLLCSACDSNKNKYQTMSSFSLNKSEITLEVNDTFAIVASYGQEKIVFSVDDNTIATVSETGLVKAVKVGTTYVNIVAGDETRMCKVEVVEYTYTVELDKPSVVNMQSGTKLTISATTLRNGNKYTGRVTWSTTGGNLISNGQEAVFTTTEKGTYTVTATTEKGVMTSCVITVGDALGDFPE